MSINKKVRTRFAPSPTGYMHVGNLRTALYAYMYARHHDGTFVLRIEDTDLERKVEGAVDIIFSSLRSAGMDYDEGPFKEGDCAPYIQSERKHLYLPFAQRMVESGHAYYCFCTRDRLAQLSESGATKYDKKCEQIPLAEAKKRIASGESYVIRQSIPREGSSSYVDQVFGEITVDFDDLEDGILIKSDGMPTYNFANVIDDHLMGITHVIRGSEYLSSTPKYNLIYDALGWERPEYIHLQPIMRDASHKLSKRDGDASFEDFVARGFLPEAIVNYIALLGWSPKENREKFTLEEMIQRFSVGGLSKSASIFDPIKMRWLNSLYIRELDDELYFQLIKPFIDRLDYLEGRDARLIARLVKGRVEVLSDVDKLMDFVNHFEGFDLQLFCHQKQKTDQALAQRILPDLVSVVEQGFDDLHTALVDYAQANGLKNGQVLWIFRIAITGAASTPGGATEMAELLGKQECLKRMHTVIQRLS